MSLTLLHINTAPLDEALSALGGVYEHSPWVMQRALALRPFASLAQLKVALAQVVAQAKPEEQLALLRAHPELAGKAMLQSTLTAESTNEQSRAGLTHCTAAELETIQQLNRDYNALFNFPFILAVRGPRGLGLSRQDIIATFARRLQGHPEFEREECLRNVHRIAEIRLTDLFDAQPEEGHAVWDWHEGLARYSEPAFAAQQQLTVTYLTEAHRQCSALLTQQMRDCGFDDVRQDAVGNVVGRYECDSWSRNEDGGYSPKTSKTLLTGSHFDTVRNGGKYDGRLGIYVPMAVVQALHRQGRRLPFALEVVAFSEEEGQRYKASFLSSSALTGHFQSVWLDQRDSEGITLRDALRHAGLDPALIPALQRDPAEYFGFVEVHIEQGPVLNGLNLPLGVVTSINASSRYQVEIIGMASHAGTTPMAQRRDAAAAAAELMLYVEQRATADAGCVGTVGMLQVPGGSVNVVPGRCHFSLDLRAPDDAQRDHLVADVLGELDDLCTSRGLRYTLTETMKASAAPSHPLWQARWEAAVQHLGLPVHRMPSGAGHDAMQMHKRMPQAMLFVRGENSGISHNPLESTTSHDMQLAIDAFRHLVESLATEA